MDKKLNDRGVANFKAASKAYKIFDGGGLYLIVYTTGGKAWRMAYRFGGKEKTLSFGLYPSVSLGMARKCRDKAKALLAQGIDPGERKKREKEIAGELTQNTFENVAKEWYETNKSRWSEKTIRIILSRLERYVFPAIGQKPLSELKAPDILAIARSVEARGAVHSAHRIMQYCNRIFRFAIATSRTEHNIVADIHTQDVLQPAKVKHHATLTDPRAVGELLRALDGYAGYSPVAYALKLAPLVFVRPGELRNARWEEFDFDTNEWRIPAGRMKMKEQHIVPLSRQAVEILQTLQSVTGQGKLLFPGARTSDRPISDNTINAALRRLGYTKEQITGHGFRSMASTILNELGWNRDAIERQLAHGERDQVRAAYNHADFLQERRRMMQAWADHLDMLRNAKRVGK
ncbi:MAG: tyrosine-type recombinase/integrase [Planctomycetota bacterium]|jgi:integrase|nr:tyrosine-type recombinase/integrase [Planctomycetota bacterium]